MDEFTLLHNLLLRHTHILTLQSDERRFTEALRQTKGAIKEALRQNDFVWLMYLGSLIG